jgi:hypothetical protein
MSHLNEVGYGYFQHLFRAWKIAFVLIVHGIFPNIWKTKASDMLCKERVGDDATRAYLLKHMYGIDESELNMYDKIKRWEFPWLKKTEKNETPSIWDRMSDRELAILLEKNKNK